MIVNGGSVQKKDFLQQWGKRGFTVLVIKEIAKESFKGNVGKEKF